MAGISAAHAIKMMALPKQPCVNKSVRGPALSWRPREKIGFVEAASLGCRFITSFRAVVAQGRVSAGEWVVIHGCGGVGLSAIMIANALGSNVIGVDIKPDRLTFAESIGATYTLNAKGEANLIEALSGCRRDSN